MARKRRVKLQSDAALGESSSHRGPDLATPGFRVKTARISRPSVNVFLTDEVCFLLLLTFCLMLVQLMMSTYLVTKYTM